MKMCTRCVMDETLPNIKFDKNGECNYCKQYDEMNKKYPIYDDEQLQNYFISLGNPNHPRYDVALGISGGADSCYLLWKMVESGLRVLPFHWDNGWNTKYAEDNTRLMIDKLGLDLYTVSMDKKEYNNLCRSFLYASVPDADIPNDIALTTVKYMVGELFDIKTIVEGHSFRTEGSMPVGWSYMDGQYIRSVQKQFGEMPLKTFPNLELERWLDWLDSGLKRVRPFYHMDYNKERAIDELTKNFGFKWYGGHHCENIYTKFIGNYVRPQKFNIDARVVEYSALIRSGQMEKFDALIKLKKQPEFNKELLNIVQKRLGITPDIFEQIMKLKVKSYKNYLTYKRTFELMKTEFKHYLKEEKISQTFFDKYVEK